MAVLLGAYASSPRATPVFGADANRLDAAAAAAREALGDEFDDLSAEGRAMTMTAQSSWPGNSRGRSPAPKAGADTMAPGQRLTGLAAAMANA